jgi:hypothetical protein
MEQVSLLAQFAWRDEHYFGAGDYPLGDMDGGRCHVEMIRNTSSNRDEAGFPPVSEKFENRIDRGFCQEYWDRDEYLGVLG